MIKKWIKVFFVCNIVILLAILIVSESGLYDEVSEVNYLEEQGQEALLAGNAEVNFRVESNLCDIENLILKFGNCTGHTQGQLSVRISDSEQEYYSYKVPLSAFTEDIFYLYTNAIPGLQDNQKVNLSIAVEQVAAHGLTLYCVEESYIETIQCSVGAEYNSISPIWGGSGSQKQLSEDFQAVWWLWLLFVVIYVIVCILIVLSRKYNCRKRILAAARKVKPYIYAEAGILTAFAIIVGIAGNLYGESMTEEQKIEGWSHENVENFKDIPLRSGEVVYSFTAQYDYLKQFVVLFDNYAPNDPGRVRVTLEDKKGKVYYSWSADCAALTGETFYLMGTVEEKLKRGREYLFRISLDEPYSNITVRGIEGENAGIYMFESYSIYFSYLKLWIGILIVTLLLFVAIVSLKDKWCPQILRIGSILNVSVTAVVSYCTIECLSGNLQEIGAVYALMNILVIAGVHLILQAFLTRAASYVTALLALFLGTVNFYVLQFRGTDFLFSDIKSFSTAMSVAQSYEFEFPAILFTGILLICCLLYLQSVVQLKCCMVYPKTGLRNRFLILGLGCALLLMVNGTTTGQKLDFYTVNNNFKDYGWCYSNLLISKYSKVEKPDGYSDETLEEILAGVEEVPYKDVIVPTNLIVIMNESLSDLGQLGNLETNQDYMPYIRSLQENTVKGNLHVPTFGGGTCITEYEFLTGNTIRFMPMGSMPYSAAGALQKEPGIASLLKEQGYHTVAMHPYERANWNRDKVYPAMEFDEFLSQEEYEDAELVRNFVSDKSDYDKIIEYCEKKEPGEKLFIFNVTMQNHGGYDSSNGELDTTISIENFESYEGETYLSLVHESDKAFEYLISYFEQVEEPTMIVMFGDHLPALPNEFYEILYGKAMDDMTREELILHYRTNYVIWTNYESEFEEVPDISTNFLGRYVLECAGVEMSRYDMFLNQYRRKVPVLGVQGIYHADGSLHTYDSLSEDILYPYKALQYLRLKDRKSDFYDIFSLNAANE